MALPLLTPPVARVLRVVAVGAWAVGLLAAVADLVLGLRRLAGGSTPGDLLAYAAVWLAAWGLGLGLPAFGAALAVPRHPGVARGLQALVHAALAGVFLHAAVTRPAVPPLALPAAPAPAAPRGPVVLLTLDTFRADHLSAIGGGPQATRTPALDALAARGAFYTRGIAHVPLTLPSHLTMLAGRPPDATALVRNGQPVDPSLPRVPAAFAAAGWRTGAFVSAGVLARRTGIAHGFGHYDDQLGPLHRALQSGLLHSIFRFTEPTRTPSQRRGDETLGRAVDWLAASDDPRPAFLWVHLYDPHAPYDPPPPYRARVTEAAEDPAALGRPEDMRALHRRLRARKRMPFIGVGLDLRAPIAAYAGEVEWTDHLVSRLVAALPPDATLLVAADHGESLLEHDYPLNHGNRLHEVALRVPILHVGPGVAPARVEDPVPLASVASTLLAAGGLPPLPGALPALAAPSAPADILSVAPVQQSRRTFGQRGVPRVSWTVGPLRVVVDDEDTLTAFDLAADPAESADIGAALADAPARRAAGRALLDTLPLRKDDVPAGDEELVEELRALGYTE